MGFCLVLGFRVLHFLFSLSLFETRFFSVYPSVCLPHILSLKRKLSDEIWRIDDSKYCTIP